MTIENKITILIPPVCSCIYYNTAKLLQYTLKDMGIEAIIKEAGDVQVPSLSIVLGWNLIPDSVKIPQPYVIYQLEPLVIPQWQEKIVQKRHLFTNALAVWDYSESNTSYLLQHCIPATVIPLGYHKALEEVCHSPIAEYDVLLTGFISERKKSLLEELQKHCTVSVQSYGGKEFKNALGNCKILLDINQHDTPTPLEQSRIAYALNNATLVITEHATDTPYPELISCEYSQLVSTVLYYLQSPMERFLARERATDAFKLVSLKHHLESFFSKEGNAALRILELSQEGSCTKYPYQIMITLD